MKKPLAVLGSLAALLFTGCTDREAEAQKAKDEADAKARAEAARKEMDALPKAFESRDYYKKNAPKKAAPAPDKKPTAP